MSSVYQKYTFAGDSIRGVVHSDFHKEFIGKRVEITHKSDVQGKPDDIYIGHVQSIKAVSRRFFPYNWHLELETTKRQVIIPEGNIVQVVAELHPTVTQDQFDKWFSTRADWIDITDLKDLEQYKDQNVGLLVRRPNGLNQLAHGILVSSILDRENYVVDASGYSSYNITVLLPTNQQVEIYSTCVISVRVKWTTKQPIVIQ